MKKSTALILFLLFSLCGFGQSYYTPNLDTSVVTFNKITALDTIDVGKRYISIENTGSINSIVFGDTIKAGVKVELNQLFDARTNTYFVLPQCIMNPGIRAFDTLTLTGNAVNGETMTIDSRAYRFVTNLDTAATGTLTISGSVANNNDTVVIGNETYRYQTTLVDADVAAKDTLIITASNALDGETFVIGSRTYTMQNGLTPGVGNIQIGSTDTITISNINKAIAASGQPNVEYSYLVSANTQVTSAVGTGDTILVITAISAGEGGNSIATTETMTNGSFTSATLLGGVTAIANDVLIGANDSLSLDNLWKAHDLSGVAGTDYTTLTAAHDQVSITQPTGTTLLVTSDTNGTTGNSYATTTTGANLSWSNATLTGGVNQVADDILIAGTASLTIDNIIATLGLTGTIGTDYANGTTISTSVRGSALAGDLMLVKSASGGLSGNSITTTETMTNGSFSNATLLSGLDGELTIIYID